MIGITDFSLHSIGVLPFSEHQYDRFTRFMADVPGEGDIQILSLNQDEVAGLQTIARKYQIDFDDTYQYAVASKFQVSLISFDRDFDKTDITRVTPEEILNSS